jgi:hypothetical protein
MDEGRQMAGEMVALGKFDDEVQIATSKSAGQ